jgi:hypothetical protein
MAWLPRLARLPQSHNGRFYSRHWRGSYLTSTCAPGKEEVFGCTDLAIGLQDLVSGNGTGRRDEVYRRALGAVAGAGIDREPATPAIPAPT